MIVCKSFLYGKAQFRVSSKTPVTQRSQLVERASYIQGLGTIIGTVQILLPYFNHLLCQVLIEGWPKIPLDNFTKLRDSIPRRIEAVLKPAGGRTAY